MVKTQITVNTAVGTFSRTTARSYSHVVVVSDATSVPGPLAWASSLDLARKAATSRVARCYTTVQIFDVVTGGEVM